MYNTMQWNGHSPSFTISNAEMPFFVSHTTLTGEKWIWRHVQQLTLLLLLLLGEILIISTMKYPVPHTRSSQNLCEGLKDIPEKL